MSSPAPDTASRMLLTVTDVAIELGRDIVYALIANGALPSVRLGGRLRRIRRGDLEAFVAGMASSMPSAPRGRDDG